MNLNKSKITAKQLSFTFINSKGKMERIAFTNTIEGVQSDLYDNEPEFFCKGKLKYRKLTLHRIHELFPHFDYGMLFDYYSMIPIEQIKLSLKYGV